MSETVAIDLGTTYSLIARYDNGEPQVIPCQNNKIQMPSVVSYVRGQSCVGQQAVLSGEMYPKNCLKVTKRLIGRLFDDPYVQQTIESQKYTIKGDNQGKTVIKVRNGKYDIFYNPEQVAAEIIKELVKNAQLNTYKIVNQAVITVPAYFNNVQRQATKEAGMLAGLRKIQLINEPTAAALWHAQQYFKRQLRSNKKRIILVFDLGGGTFDVSICEVTAETADAIAIGGDADLGGEDFTQLIMEHVLSNLQEKLNFDCKFDNNRLFRLRQMCENAKRELSSSESTNILLINFMPSGDDYDLLFNKNKFEELCEDLFVYIIDLVQQVIQDANISAQDIDDVVMVGGSCRIPKLKQMLEDLLGRQKKIQYNNVDLDQAVVCGAAIKAAIIDEKFYGRVSEVTSLSLGIGLLGDVMDVVIKRNTSYPLKKKSIEYSSSLVDQTCIESTILEGERPLVKGNIYLGKIQLDDLPERPLGALKIYFIFQIDDSGLLQVTMKHDESKRESIATIDQLSQQRCIQDVEQHLLEAKRMREQDQYDKQHALAWKDLHQYMHSLKTRLKYKDLKNLSKQKKQKLDNLADDALQWVSENQSATIKQFKQKQKYVQQQIAQDAI